jgi:16S rRNA (adenine1518-N6/adenine1519-N6)-dimethyltransferase
LQPANPPPYEIDDWSKFSLIVSQAFMQRRKTLRNSLRKLMADDVIEAAGIKPDCRAEQLSVEQFACLANQAVRMNNP